MLALKTRNAIILSPHPHAVNCSIAAAKIMRDAAVEAGLPEHVISWISVPSLEISDTLMKSVDLIMATGGSGMVKAAYSSGTPAIGVGPATATWLSTRAPTCGWLWSPSSTPRPSITA